MSEPATEPAESATDPAPEAPDLGDAGKKAIDRMKVERDEARRQAKANAEAATELAAFKAAQLTEAERNAQARTAAEERATTAEREVIRLRIIAEVGLEPDLHEFVAGDDEDAMRAKAEKLKARMGPTDTSAPRPDMTQGARTNPAAGDPAQEFARWMKAAQQ